MPVSEFQQAGRKKFLHAAGRDGWKLEYICTTWVRIGFKGSTWSPEEREISTGIVKNYFGLEELIVFLSRRKPWSIFQEWREVRFHEGTVTMSGVFRRDAVAWMNDYPSYARRVFARPDVAPGLGLRNRSSDSDETEVQDNGNESLQTTVSSASS